MSNSPLFLMPYHRYLAEMLGAFALTFVVWLSVAYAMPFPTPVMAALTLGLFVYLVGGISGAHLNPAITVALLTLKKISSKDAVFYVLSQLIGAAVAMFLGTILSGAGATVAQEGGLVVAVAETIGAFFLAFGVMSVVKGKVPEDMAGVVIGSSLFIGIYTASPFGNAILNPAVALGIGSFSAMYILGPIAGAIAGAWACEYLWPARGKKS